MGVDLTVNLQCSVKSSFGSGDCSRGTLVIHEALKAQARALALRQHVKDPAHPPVVRIIRNGPDGPAEQTVTLEALVAEGDVLDGRAGPCEGCPASMASKPYGCFMHVPYPVPESGERWLMERLQVYGQPGGDLFLSAFDNLGFDGAPVAEWRARGLFESKVPVTKIVRKRVFRSTRISSDQVFHLLFAAGPSLSREHCVMALELLGGVDLSDPRLPKLHIGERSDDRGIVAMKTLLLALFGAFINKVDLLVDA
jgi:hypothetical protein